MLVITVSLHITWDGTATPHRPSQLSGTGLPHGCSSQLSLKQPLSSMEKSSTVTPVAAAAVAVALLGSGGCDSDIIIIITFNCCVTPPACRHRAKPAVTSQLSETTIIASLSGWQHLDPSTTRSR